MRERGGEIARQRLAVAADDRQCNRLAALRFRFAGQCAGQFRQRQAMAVAELAAQRLQITCESRDVGSAEQAQLMRPALRAGGAITGWVLFEHNVEIGAAKAKRGRAAATRMLRIGQTWARLARKSGGGGKRGA